MLEQEQSPLCQFLLFRGQGQDYPLLPAIARSSDDACNNLLSKEKIIIESMKKLKPDIFKQEYNAVDTLALLQHYGIPTRLLDVTENALVALYFACEDQDDKHDGVVYVFRDNEFSLENYDVVENIAGMCRYPNQYQLTDFYDKSHPSNKDMDSEYKITNIKAICEDYIFVRSSIRNQRQYNQSGSFILYANQIIENEDYPAYFSSAIKETKKFKNLIQTIGIKGEKKKEILNDIKMCGITKSFIYPDKIDYVGKDLLEKLGERGTM